MVSFLISGTLTAIIPRKAFQYEMSAFFCPLVLISIHHFITVFFSIQAFCFISVMVAYWAIYSTGGLPVLRTQPLCPWSNYSKKNRTFLLCEGAFPWLPSSPAVESSSAQLLLHSESTRESKCPAETWWVLVHYQHWIFWPISSSKPPQLIFTATYRIRLNIRWAIFLLEFDRGTSTHTV